MPLNTAGRADRLAVLEARSTSSRTRSTDLQ